MAIVIQNEFCMLREEPADGFTLLVCSTNGDWREYLHIYRNGYTRHALTGNAYRVGFDNPRAYALQAFFRETDRRLPF